MTPRRSASAALRTPLVLAALAAWALNDHVLKEAFSSWWTGKLSDVTSLIVFPLLPVAALELWREARRAPPPGNGHLVFWVVATGVVMATINTLDAAALAYQHGLGAAQWPFMAVQALLGGRPLPPLHTVALTMDPTDMLTLPALLVPLRLAWRTAGEGPRVPAVVCRSAALATALVLAGCGGGPSASDAGADSGPDPMPNDASTADASTTDGGATDAAPPRDGGSGACGTARPEVSSIQLTEGLVIARDGTMYVSQSSGVGRMLPDGTIDDRWLRITGASTVLGLALDAANAQLFVGVPDFDGAGAASVYRVEVASATATPIVTGGAPNGLTIGPDGRLYYSDFIAGHVFRVGASGGAPMQVTTSAIGSPNGVAFEPGGTLLVASYSTGNLYRLTLSASGTETAREPVGLPGGTLDGIALDASGRIYLTDQFGGRLLRMNADGTDLVTLAPGLNAPANIEFGSGTLDCMDLYITSAGGLTRFANDTPGADVPWH